MIRPICVSLLILSALLYVSANAAGVYRWVDENGKVHFSDQPPAEKKVASDVDTLDIAASRQGDVKRSAINTPIPFQGEGKPASLVLENIAIDLKDSHKDDVPIGITRRGRECKRSGELFWTGGMVDLEDAAIGTGIEREFKEAGYLLGLSARRKLPVFGDAYALLSTIEDIELSVCYPEGHKHTSKAAAYIKVRWKLEDRLRNRVLHQVVTEGSADGLDSLARKDALTVMVGRAFGIAARNLLADKDFVAQVSIPTMLPAMEKGLEGDSREALSLALREGDRSADFRARASSLTAAAVTIKTRDGHGSGVVIDEQGHVLTNTHVVGESRKVFVSDGVSKTEAVVLRRNPIRDVALLKLDTSLATGRVHISAAEMQVGDSVYVIGTPLNESLNHSITKGIMSAYREIGGLAFYQTDAVVNPGNSGGPAFDEHGELAAITVAGMFTDAGGNLGVNYLIPVADALRALNIVLPAAAAGKTVRPAAAAKTVTRRDAAVVPGGHERAAMPPSARNPDAAYDAYQQALQYKSSGMYVRAEKLLAKAIGQLNENDPYHAIVADELYFHLPMASARFYLRQQQAGQARAVLRPVPGYLKNHPRRFEYLANVEELLSGIKMLDEAVQHTARAALRPIWISLREYFFSMGSYPATRTEFEKLYTTFADLKDRYIVESYESNGKSYVARFYDSKTGNTLQLESEEV